MNLPPLILRLLVAIAAIHLLRGVLSDPQEFWLLGRFAFIPERFVAGLRDFSDPLVLVSPLSYQFLHGDFGHLAMNGFGLVIFGTMLARSFPERRVLWLYLLTGAFGAIGYAALLDDSRYYLIGASASISGLVGAVAFALYDNRLRGVPQGGMPAFIALWVALNVLPGLLPVQSGVAYLAHGAGFVGGILLYPSLLRNSRR